MPSLEFKGKPFVYAHHLTTPYRPLTPDPARSAGGTGADDNLIVHGDNLHALKALLPRYAGRVRCVYIDPPYNTGNENWVYNDNVNGPLMQEWRERNGFVDREDLERHDKWLCMMWPRLQLLRELLAEDGVIFVSIDHNEEHHLRMLMDEIFFPKRTSLPRSLVRKKRMRSRPNDSEAGHFNLNAVLCAGVRQGNGLGDSVLNRRAAGTSDRSSIRSVQESRTDDRRRDHGYQYELDGERCKGGRLCITLVPLSCSATAQPVRHRRGTLPVDSQWQLRRFNARKNG